MEFKYFVLLLAIIGMAFLYFLSTLSQPIVIELHEIPEYEDKQVIVEGTVIKHSVTSYGGQIIEIDNINNFKNSSKTLVFVEKETSVEFTKVNGRLL